MVKKVFLLILIIFISCKLRKKEERLTPEIIYARIVNPYARKGELLKIDYKTIPEEGRGKAIIRWYLKGEIIQEGKEDTLRLLDVKRGDKIYAEVSIKYKEKEISFKTQEIEVQNSSPLITNARFEPSIINSNTRKLKIIPEGYDPDGDPLQFFARWRINKEVLEDSSLEIILPSLKTGDTIEALLFASDGDVRSYKTFVLKTSVINSPPTIKNFSFKYIENKIHVKVIAEDQDGDNLFLFLINSNIEPLKVIPESLLIVFPYKENIKTFNLKVKVEDPFHNAVEKEITLNIKL